MIRLIEEFTPERMADPIDKLWPSLAENFAIIAFFPGLADIAQSLKAFRWHEAGGQLLFAPVGS